GRLVHRLEEPAAEGAEVDDRTAREDRRGELSIDPPEPARLPQEIEAVGMLEVEQRLRLPVPHLLLQVGLPRVPPPLPTGRRRSEADGVVPVLEPPPQAALVAPAADDRLP